MSETYTTDSAEALAEALRKCRMTAYDDGKGGHLFRSATPDEQAAALIASGAVRHEAEVRAEAFEQGWHKGHEDACEYDAQSCAERHHLRAALAEGGDLPDLPLDEHIRNGL